MGEKQILNKLIMDTIQGNAVVKHLGEWIFPQKLNSLIERFSEDEIMKAIERGLIMKSVCKIGSSVQRMRKVAGYVELTEAGWSLYNTITPKPSPNA